MLANKTQDPTIRRDYLDHGWKRIKKWSDHDPSMRRIVLWPEATHTQLRERARVQAPIFGDALNAIDHDGNWCVFADETHYLTSTDFCGLGPEVALLHHQGRSSGISIVTAFQRPAWIPRIIYSSATHAYIARTRDAADLRQLADLGGIDARELAYNVRTLPSRYDFVYVNPQGDADPVIVNTRE
jgi:hypothetical protein